MRAQHLIILAAWAAAGLALSGGRLIGEDPFSLPPPPVAPGNSDDIVAAIRDAKDAPAAAAAYDRLDRSSKFSPAVHAAYMKKMLKLGMPQAALSAANVLVGPESTNGTAFGVVAYVAGKHGKYDEALPPALKAARLAPDDPSIQNYAGQLITWYEGLKTPYKLDGASKSSLARVKSALTGKKPYDDACARVKDALDRQQSVAATADKSITDAQAGLAALQKTSQDLDTQISDLKTKIADTQARLNAANNAGGNGGRGPGGKNRAGPLTVQLNNLEGQLKTLTDQSAQLARQISDKNASIAALQKQSDSQTRVAAAFVWDPPAVDGVVTPEVTAATSVSGGSSPPVSDDEAAATTKLQVARNYLQNKMQAEAVAALKDIVDRYPNTAAGAQARKLLETTKEPVPQK